MALGALPRRRNGLVLEIHNEDWFSFDVAQPLLSLVAEVNFTAITPKPALQLDLYGPGLGLLPLREAFPLMNRAELEDLLHRYCRVWRQRHRRPHLSGSDLDGAPRRLSRRHRSGHPARHRRHQEFRHGGRR